MKIVRTRIYARALKRMGVAAAEVEALERGVASNPGAGDVVPGLTGEDRRILLALVEELDDG